MKNLCYLRSIRISVILLKRFMMFFLIMFALGPVLNKVHGQTVDGNYFPKTGGTDDEYYGGFTQYIQSASSTCQIEQIWAKIMTDGSGVPIALKLGFQNGNSGRALFRIYLDTDNDPLTGLLNDTDLNPDFAVSGAEIVIQIDALAGSTVVYDQNLNALAGTSIVGAAGDFNPADGEFFEIYIPFDDIGGFDICNPSGTINIAQYVAVSGGSIGSSICGSGTLSFQVGVAGEVTPDREVCPGTGSGLLTLSGNSGTVVGWQYSVDPFTDWIDIVNTSSTYTSDPLYVTTKFRAVVEVPGCPGTDLYSIPATVSVYPSPNVSAGLDKLLTCTVTSVTLNGSSTTEGVSYLWTTSDGNITSAANIAEPTVNAPGTYTLTVTDPDNGCYASDNVLVTKEICDYEAFCTYTQGFYGSQRGSACDLTESMPGDAFVEALLSKGNLIIGSGSNTITFKSGDSGLIKNILPGGSGTGVLSGICIPSEDNVCILRYLTKKGTLNNGLLAQTLTLGLNLRATEGLGLFELEGGRWLTTQKIADCGSPDVVEKVCTPIYNSDREIIGYTLTVNPYWYGKINEGVLCYMSKYGYSMDVDGLYRLANDALGQVRTFPEKVNCSGVNYNIKLSDIASAVDLINNAFDECRSFVGYLDEKITCPSVTKSEILKSDIEDVILKVYPNPFSTTVRFELELPYDSHVRIDIYDYTGAFLGMILDEDINAGNIRMIEFDASSYPDGSYWYVVTTKYNVLSGPVIKN